MAAKDWTTITACIIYETDKAWKLQRGQATFWLPKNAVFAAQDEPRLSPTVPLNLSVPVDLIRDKLDEAPRPTPSSMTLSTPETPADPPLDMPPDGASSASLQALTGLLQRLHTDLALHAQQGKRITDAAQYCRELSTYITPHD